MNTRHSSYLILVISAFFAFAPAALPAQEPASGSPAAASGAPFQSRAEVERRLARRALENRAATARYEKKDFAACGSLYEEAGNRYYAACCYALAGKKDEAFAQLALAIDGSFRDIYLLDRDTDFALVRDDPRWAKERARLAAKVEAGDGVNAELLKIFTEDQGDRRPGPGKAVDWAVVGPRDKERRARVEAILAAGGAKFSADYHHAAMVFQHGESVAEIQRAHELAVEAIKLDPDNDLARWLAAAAEDRKLMYENKPQKWGTQFKVVDGKWVVWNVDPKVTDAQREEWNVPTLAQAQARAEQMNANQPKPNQ
jgi:hypothetical protein